MRWFKIYGQKWIVGTTRGELRPDERGVWIDLLALASISETPGQIDYLNLKELARTLKISLKLLEKALKKFGKFKKIKHLRQKRQILVLNWKKYQDEYQRQLPYRKGDAAKKGADNFSNEVTCRGEERRREEKRKEKKKGEESLKKILQIQILSFLPSPPTPKNLKKRSRMNSFNC